MKRTAAVVATALSALGWTLAGYVAFELFKYFVMPPGHVPAWRALDLLLPFPALVALATLTIPALRDRRFDVALRWGGVFFIALGAYASGELLFPGGR